MFLFFWYFSGVTQLLIQLTGTAGFAQTITKRNTMLTTFSKQADEQF